MIIQGSTPKIKINCNNFNPLTMKDIEISIESKNIIITKKLSDLVLSASAITFYLSQMETFNLSKNHEVRVQLRVKTGLKVGDIEEVKVSKIITTTVEEFIGLKVSL